MTNHKITRTPDGGGKCGGCDLELRFLSDRDVVYLENVRPCPQNGEVKCDKCFLPVEVRGVEEPYYAHVNTGLVFCTTVYATVDGRTTP